MPSNCMTVTGGRCYCEFASVVEAGIEAQYAAPPDGRHEQQVLEIRGKHVYRSLFCIFLQFISVTTPQRFYGFEIDMLTNLWSVHVYCILYIVYRISYIVYRISYIVYRISYIVYRISYIVHCTLYIVHCTLYIVYCSYQSYKMIIKCTHCAHK